MRTPLPQGTAINTHRMRRWVLNFASYRHQVSEQSVSDWLAQFDEQDRDAAARLLDAVDFFTLDRVSAAFRGALTALPGWHSDANQRSGKWRFAGLSRSAGESADAMIHRFRVANALDKRRFNELFIYPSQILLQGLGPDDTLVLIDDFVGTGDSVSTAWNESFAELVPDVGQVFLLVAAAVSQGRARVAEETSMTCIAGHELTLGDNFFGTACRSFTEQEKRSMLKYCKRANVRDPKGYKECGLVLTFSHRCPNNSLPILHADHNNWTGLFPRHG